MRDLTVRDRRRRPDRIFAGIRAAWRGLMVGIERGDSLPLVGDAVLAYGGGAAIDAAFTEIRYLEGDSEFRAGASTPNVRFENVPVSADGTCGSGTVGNRIQGGFYGPRRGGGNSASESSARSAQSGHDGCSAANAGGCPGAERFPFPLGFPGGRRPLESSAGRRRRSGTCARSQPRRRNHATTGRRRRESRPRFESMSCVSGTTPPRAGGRLRPGSRSALRNRRRGPFGRTVVRARPAAQSPPAATATRRTQTNRKRARE